MADPHTVPLPASRGSLDQPRPDFHHPHHSTLADVDEGDSSADAAWFDDGTAPPDDDEPSAAPPDEPEHDDDARPRPPPAGESGVVGDSEPAADDEEQGHAAGAAVDGQDGERIQLLEDELDRTRQDRDAWEAQYQGLLAKLTAMRNTLGDKLKQDADELDRREQEIADLRAANDDLASTLDTLKGELIQSHADADALHTEVEQLRARAFDSERASSDEAQEREVALREAQEDLERVRIERDEWEGEAMRERVRREDQGARLGVVEMELAQAKADREVLREERDREMESAANLHAVLEEFQAAKDRELQALLGDLETQLRETQTELDTYRQRASRAEAQLDAAHDDSEKVLVLSREVKEKNLLIGKLRHEAVILNEHLTEALRRLKKDSGENSVDRRLVSNVLITFLNTPRGDAKRFEMLQLISSILSWTDDQREKVGLQRSSGSLSSASVISSGRGGAGKGHARSGTGKAVDEGVENESFSNLWIEFLLKESAQAAPSASSPPASAKGGSTRSPTSPRADPFDLPPLGSPPLSSTTSTPRRSLSSFFSSSNGGSASPAASAPSSTAPPSIPEDDGK
ncbi:uncharacterized protein RHOBADRAFT_53339 [Rhodotorula graminis WP1]|uniref:GRIP domain-containing protein n=1 Tax=Rhodotorula graminis (strain WP1) TaxID=578459 RepID=A0A194S3P1_RHOGW|nr:uncharacterized protein RHOBADRAFT_53339 [Rhodotorula graminis WP1]KPV75353.1 hypothetical protein RHOBADRAFT_53339 [Rhodotorula graminis WP1]